MRTKIINILFIISMICAQSPADPSSDKASSDKPLDSQKKKTMDEVLKGKKEIPGYFTMYQDTLSGKLFMLIKKSNLKASTSILYME